MLRPEEKQFGPWIRLTQDKYQKPLTVTVAKNGDSRIREEGAEIREHRKDGITGRATATDIPNNDNPGLAERLMETRDDVVNIETLPGHIQIKIPKILLILNFEQQLRDIDAAISGEVSDVNSIQRKEINLEREEISLNQNDAKLGRNKRPHANGFTTKAQPHISTLGPQGPLMKSEHK